MTEHTEAVIEGNTLMAVPAAGVVRGEITTVGTELGRTVTLCRVGAEVNAPPI